SIYHSITAVLALEQIAFKRHKDTIAYFNKEYVKTEKFSRQLGRRIGRAQEIRHASDYDEFYIASVEEAQEQIDT
ncbi:HEPN domain-containing protein, partial [Eggerthella lenta]|nr:HEPN domain-containing protein [Eggerthella lenta]